MTALFAAMTPMVVFTTATVNPSGLAAAVAALIWAAGVNVTSPRMGTPVRASAWTLVMALMLYPFLRRDALSWEVALLLILASTLTGTRLRALVRDRAAVGAAALAATAMGGAWLTWSAPAIGSFVAQGARRARGSWTAGGRALFGYLHEIVGVFGWLGTPVSREPLLPLMGTLAVVLVVGAASGSRVEARASLIALLVLVVAPLAIGAIQFPYLQGRYLFPVFFGAVLTAGQALAGAAPLRRLLLRATLAALAVVQFLAFAQNLRRYAVGSSATWRYFLASPRWQPPMMSNGTALLLALAAIGAAIVVTRAALRGAPRVAHDDRRTSR